MTAFAAILVIALAWGALAFGAVYPWAYTPLAVVCGAIGLWGAVRMRAWQDTRLRPVLFGLAAIAAAIAVQLVPLPSQLFVKGAPAVDAYFAQQSMAYERPAWHALSLQPGSTAVALGLFAALAIFLVGVTSMLPRIRLDWLVSRLIVLGVALAIVGVVQKAVGARVKDGWHELVYGFWETREGGKPFGPFINRNHFAGWMVMMLPVAIGYSCAVVQKSHHPRGGDWRRWLHWSTSPDASRFSVVVFCLFAMATALVLTASRSGIVAFAIAIVAMAFLAPRREASMRRLAPIYLTVLLVGAVGWAGVNATVARFSDASGDAGGRLMAWRDTTRMVADAPWFGLGLGSYGDAMLVYQTASRETLYRQAHNDYLQLAAEGGLLVGVPVVACLVLLVRRMRRRFAAHADDTLTHWIRIGAVAGLAGIAAQSFVEFSLQMPGNAVLFALLLALAIHRPRRIEAGKGR